MLNADGVNIAGQIDRIASPTIDEFRRYASKTAARPVIITGALAGVKALSWTGDYLKSKVGDKTVHLYVSANGKFPGGKGPHDPALYRHVDLPLSECIDRINGDVSRAPIIGPGERYYIYQSPESTYTEVMDEVPTPKYVTAQTDVTPTRNLWISPAGNVTPGHYDFAENILMQLCGTKRLLLWSPADYERLYLHPLNNHALDRQSQIDMQKPDTIAFPKFAKAGAWEGVIEPGDMVYIPFAWVHWLQSQSFSVSASCWWPLRLDDGGLLGSLWKAMLLQWAVPVRNTRAELKPLLRGLLKERVKLRSRGLLG